MEVFLVHITWARKAISGQKRRILVIYIYMGAVSATRVTSFAFFSVSNLHMREFRLSKVKNMALLCTGCGNVYLVEFSEHFIK